MFDGGALIFKGGTSLRKCRLANAGRFSTDLDFAAPDEDVVLDVCAAIDGPAVSGFTFTLHPTRGDGRHWSLRIKHDDLGSPDVEASGRVRSPAVVAGVRATGVRASARPSGL
jgi:predicted nucleotidyltransferase component of viral defense system